MSHEIWREVAPGRGPPLILARLDSAPFLMLWSELWQPWGWRHRADGSAHALTGRSAGQEETQLQF